MHHRPLFPHFPPPKLMIKFTENQNGDQIDIFYRINRYYLYLKVTEHRPDPKGVIIEQPVIISGTDYTSNVPSVDAPEYPLRYILFEHRGKPVNEEQPHFQVSSMYLIFFLHFFEKILFSKISIHFGVRESIKKDWVRYSGSTTQSIRNRLLRV